MAWFSSYYQSQKITIKIDLELSLDQIGRYYQGHNF